jgi:hypothetical protein
LFSETDVYDDRSKQRHQRDQQELEKRDIGEA